MKDLPLSSQDGYATIVWGGITKNHAKVHQHADYALKDITLCCMELLIQPLLVRNDHHLQLQRNRALQPQIESLVQSQIHHFKKQLNNQHC